MFTDAYGEQSCTAGRAVLHHRPERLPHRALEGRPARRARRAPGRGPDDRRAPQAARLCDGPVRQEPPRRSEQVPADGARLRRVLRQPVPPQRRGGARGSRLSEGPAVQGQVRPARRHPLLGDRQRRPDRGAALGPRRQAEDQGHRPPRPASAWRPATTSSSRRPRTSSSASTRPASRSSCGSTRRTCTCGRTPSRRASDRPAAPVAVPRHDDRPRQERGRDARLSRRARHHRQHVRHVLDRQRTAHEQLAGWRR